MKTKVLILAACGMILCATSLYVPAFAAGTSDTEVVFTDVAGEYYHFLALDTQGNVWGWGNNIAGQLGDRSQSYHTVPVKIAGFDHVKIIAAGYDHSTVVKQDGTVWVWGPDQRHSQPVQVKGISDVIALADSAYYTLALRQDGTVWGWGDNKAGQLGNGQTGDSVDTPVQVKSLSNVTSIAAAYDEGLAVTSDGQAWRWGAVMKCSGPTCQKEIETTPIRFEGLNNASSISDEIAILRDGTVVKWGINYQGSIGTGSTEYAYFPNPIPLPTLTNIVQVSKSRALTKDGRVWSWGRNDYGQVGDGTTDSRPRPIELKLIDNVADISSGEEITVALTRDGKIYEWGNNDNGQISNVAADIMPPTPVPLTPDSAITYALPIPWHPNSWTYAWTYLDDKGSIVKDNQVYYKVRPFSEGFAAVHRASNNLWTFIDVHGEPAIEKDFIQVKDFHQGAAGVKDQQGWHFIDAKGEFLNRDSYRNVDSFANGLAPVLVGTKWGYIDLSGRMAIAPQFASAQSYANGLAAVKLNGKWGFIDTSGKFVIKAVYSAAGSFTGKAAAVSQNGKWGYVNKSGAWMIKPQYEDAKAFSSTQLAPVKAKGKWGYINLSGKFVISAQYEDAAPFQEGLASVKKKGLWAIIDGKGKTITPFQFVEVQPYNNKFAWVVTATDNGYVDTAGKWYYKAPIVRLP